MLGLHVESCDLEGEDFDTLKHALVMLEELLSVPGVVEIFSSVGMLASCGVSAGDEVSDSTSNTGRAMPHDFSGASIEHGRGPDSQDNVLLGKGAVINECLMLFHSRSKRDIVIFAPSTEGVKEKDGVLVSLLQEILSGLLEE